MAKHDPIDADETAERIADLRAKLRAREGYMAYAENCAALRAEIDRLESLLPKDA